MTLTRHANGLPIIKWFMRSNVKGDNDRCFARTYRKCGFDLGTGRLSV